MSGQEMQYFEVVKTVELDPINMVDGDNLIFRLEIVKNSCNGECHPNLWRIEHYRIQPTFPQKNGVPSVLGADEEIFVKDSVTLGDIKGSNEDDVLQAALKIIQEKFT